MTGYSAFQSNAFQNNAFQIARNNVTPVTGGYIPQLGHPPDHKKKRKGGFTWIEQPKPEQIVIVKPEIALPAPEATKEPPRKLTSFAELGEAFAGQMQAEALKAAAVAENIEITRQAKIAKAKADLLADDEEVMLAYMLIN